MSHTATVESKMTDSGALADACRELGLAEPKRETVKFYDGQKVEGVAVRLKGWMYPVVLTDDGRLVMDDYKGSWGKPQELAALRQHYALAVARRTVGAQYRVQHQQQPDGSMRVVLTR